MEQIISPPHTRHLQNILSGNRLFFAPPEQQLDPIPGSNEAIRRMIPTLSNTSDDLDDVHLAVVSFALMVRTLFTSLMRATILVTGVVPQSMIVGE